MFFSGAYLFFFGCSHSRKPDFSGVARWQADFHQLQGYIDRLYPNLDVALTKRGLDLMMLSKETEAVLAAAKSDSDAFGILSGFVAKFVDPHFKLVPADVFAGSSDAPPLLDSNDSGVVACQRLRANGSKDKNVNSGFPHAHVAIAGKKMGIVRIPSFVESHYPAFCAEEWDRYRESFKGGCAEQCQRRFLRERLSNRLISEFERVIREFNKAGVKTLVVDVTNNGGGTSWEDAIVRVLTGQELKCGRFEFVRGAHWAAQFEKEQAETLLALNMEHNFGKKSLLSLELARTEKNLNEAGMTCERSLIWSIPGFRPSCSVVADLVRGECVPDAVYRYQDGLYRGRLFVLVNRHTHSAAEDLAARLQENDAARIVGEKTGGSGCGYTNGGLKLVLQNSGGLWRVNPSKDRIDVAGYGAVCDEMKSG